MIRDNEANSDRPFFNREWSWLRFNERVLEEAEDPRNPLLERLKFVSIFCNNLDEFFMVRVASLYRQLEAGIPASGIDRRSPRGQLDGVHELAHALLERQEVVLSRVLAELAEQGIEIVSVEQLDEDGKAFAKRYYDEVIYPVLTPMIVGPKHPFPKLQNLNLYLVLRLRELRSRRRKDRDDRGRRRTGFVALPKVLPRFLRVGSAGVLRLVPIESILLGALPGLFAGYKVSEINAIRVTRDADIALDEEATEDMRRAMAKKLLGRRHGAAVCLEHGSRIDDKLLEQLAKELELSPDQFYRHTNLMQATDLMQVYGSIERADLKDVPLTPVNLRDESSGGSIFDWIREKPRLVYHPYHTFQPVAELVSEAAADPNVLAIKQTLYRTSGNSPVIRALTAAAEAGKSVTVVVELRARFDEERNIEWAQRLEQAGAHVVYGLVGYKTHCKSLLVVRRDPDGIRRYMHLGTGNYNDATARIYTDMGLFTCDDLVGEDISALFNVITGATQPPPFNAVAMSPNGIRDQLLAMIRREIEKSARRSRGHIIAKMNSVVHKGIIEALYEASQAGVRVDLIVRGICCLRPGVKGLSENIHVRSVVGRYLEHARVFWFKNGGQEQIYLSSADWMGRNLERRVELMFPVELPQHVAYIKGVFDLQLKDNVKARVLAADGSYSRVTRKREVVDSQVAIQAFTAEARAASRPVTSKRFTPLARGRSSARRR
jgi:polyphosphate kinase